MLPMVHGENVFSLTAATGFMRNCEPASHVSALSGQHEEPDVHPESQSC